MRKDLWFDYLLVGLISVILIPTLYVLLGFYAGLPTFYAMVFGYESSGFYFVLLLYFAIPFGMGWVNKKLFRRVSTRAIVLLTALSLVVMALVVAPLFGWILQMR